MDLWMSSMAYTLDTDLLRPRTKHQQDKVYPSYMDLQWEYFNIILFGEVWMDDSRKNDVKDWSTLVIHHNKGVDNEALKDGRM